MLRPSRIAPSAVVLDGVDLENGVTVGPGAVLHGPSTVRAGARIDANAILAPPLPGEEDETRERGERCLVESGAVIGAGAVVHPGVRIGRDALIAPATLVTRNVPPLARVGGNPAIIHGYRDTPSFAPDRDAATVTAADTPGVRDSGVAGVTVHRLPHVRDLRGDLSIGEFATALPFAPRRYFLVFDVPSESTRGEHAHRVCHQFLVCVSGRCALIADDGSRRAEIPLEEPSVGVHVPPGIWGIQYRYSPGAVLLVFASHPYDARDYIRDYGEFLAWKRGGGRA